MLDRDNLNVICIDYNNNVILLVLIVGSISI